MYLLFLATVRQIRSQCQELADEAYKVEVAKRQAEEGGASQEAASITGNADIELKQDNEEATFKVKVDSTNLTHASADPLPIYLL